MFSFSGVSRCLHCTILIRRAHPNLPQPNQAPRKTLQKDTGYFSRDFRLMPLIACNTSSMTLYIRSLLHLLAGLARNGVEWCKLCIELPSRGPKTGVLRLACSRSAAMRCNVRYAFIIPKNLLPRDSSVAG